MTEKLSPEERLNYLYAYCKFDDKHLFLDFWQEDFIMSTKQFISILKSRRTGFSFATALKGLAKALDPGRQKYVKQFVSYNESDALEKIRYAREFYESIPKWAKKPIVTENKTELEFLDANGRTTSRLISMPCRPPRGKGGDISLDEYGIFLPNMSRLVYTAALYVISRGGNIEVGSTPLGCIGRFYEICTDKKKYPSYQRFNVPWWFSTALCKDVESAVKVAQSMNTEERVEMFATDTLKEIFNNDVLEDFQQECECMFIDSAESYITLEEIYGCTPGMDVDIRDEGDTDLLPGGAIEELYFNRELKILRSVDDMCTMPYTPEKDGILYIGYDIAKKRDATSIFLLGKLSDGHKKVYGYEELRAKDFEFQIDCIRKLMKSLPIRRVCLDSTGMGMPICERLEKEFGAKIEGVVFNSDTKEVMAQNIKIGLQRKEFILPNDKNLHHQIHSIRRIPTTGGHFRYDADRDENGHADSFWALALANLACTDAAKQGFYERRAERRMGGFDSAGESKIITPEESEHRLPRGKSLRAINRSFGF
jgi:phage FluMu gp28-like protein